MGNDFIRVRVKPLRRKSSLVWCLIFALKWTRGDSMDDYTFDCGGFKMPHMYPTLERNNNFSPKYTRIT